MHLQHLHDWDVDYTEAVAIQKRLRPMVQRSGAVGRVRTVGGVDVSYDRGDDRMHAGVVVWDIKTEEVIEVVTATVRVPFPYIPGLLTFREGPPLEQCFSRLPEAPDVMLFDGQGIAHPRRMGVAAHLGLWIDMPSIGCAKSRLTGTHPRDPAPAAGSYVQLRDGREVIGSVLRTRTGVKPVYVSIGHRIDLARARKVVLQCCRGYRLPEPARIAHRVVNEVRRAGG